VGIPHERVSPPGKEAAVVPSRAHQKAWDDWGTVNPMFGILVDPRYRHGGDLEEFLHTGDYQVGAVLDDVTRLGLGGTTGSALDFGCGVGRLTRALSFHFDAVTGIDVSAPMLAKAREINADRQNCTFVLNTAGDLRSFPDASFDFVLCLLVLQHLESPRAMEIFLQEFVRVLRPGGVLVVQIPAEVPASRIPLPPLRSRAGVRTRTANTLRWLGVGPGYLYDKLGWVPQMTMTPLPEARVRAAVAAAGGDMVRVSPPDVDSGGTVSMTYSVTRAG
jgi:SAM-dependent methyltransferase